MMWSTKLELLGVLTYEAWSQCYEGCVWMELYREHSVGTPSKTHQKNVVL